MQFYMFCSIQYTQIVGHGRLHSRIQPLSEIVVFAEAFEIAQAFKQQNKRHVSQEYYNYYAGVPK